MSPKLLWLLPVALLLAYLIVRQVGPEFVPPATFPVLDATDLDPAPPPGTTELATFGSGCFWCTEAVFLQLKGVSKVVSGYSGGKLPDPTYRDICTGDTGHAEVVQVAFDPAVISYAELLEVFWRSHDPTTKDRQGNDSGPQYRSVVFAHADRQKRQAEKYKALIDAAGVFPRPVVTEVVPFAAFYPAEADHQDFYARNPRQGYCRAVIAPKVDKLRDVFRDKLKE